MHAIAAFISPHGFGHAARASATLLALKQKLPELGIEIFTTVPRWFFEQSLSPHTFGYHEVPTDVGLVQRSALEEDILETLEKLSTFIPFEEATLDNLSDIARSRSVSHILCDISPLGIAVAERLGIPSILIENFTWDWIYEGYLAKDTRFASYALQFRELFQRATLHIRTHPVCGDYTTAVIVPPISRERRLCREQVRAHLGISSRYFVLLTMGGHVAEYKFLDKLKEEKEVTFLVASQESEVRRDGNLILFPPRSSLYHPDLVAASDLVIAKLGYSTVAESWMSGTPVAYISRDSFRESKVLESFVTRELPSFRIDLDSWEDGTWIPGALSVLGVRRAVDERKTGSEIVADYLIKAFV